MEFIGYFFMIIVFFYVLDTNSKVKTLYRKIYLEDENEKGHTFRILNQNIGKTIKITIKESYSEFGRLDEATLDTLDENKVKEAFAIKREEVISEAANNYGVNRKDFNIEKYASKLVDTTSIFAYKSIEEETNVKVTIRVVVPDLYMKSK